MGSKIAVGVTVVVAMLPVLLGAVPQAVVTAFTGNGSTTCTPSGTTTRTVPGYGPDQLANAAIITSVGNQLQVTEPGWVIAVAVAIQESTLRNLDHGDRDSLGLFQQRPSQGWGTPQQIMDPTYAATQFYRHLQAVPSWQQMSLNDAAQAVQRSGTPEAYGRHEADAEAIVAAVAGVACEHTGTGDCTNIAAPTPAALTAINYACGQRGLPYVWGGNGPELGDAGFDCSGLTRAAYGAAGIPLPRTSREQYAAGPRVPAGAPLLPGDLVFYATAGRVHHVGLYVGGGNMIDAPDFGQAVRVEPYRHSGDGYIGSTRPVSPR
ncbi:NlpC/P60 family protein [Amycolatopsis balhimycina DSM 5908]|uniref:NlpC/P60 family protein n=1 Tax=Amycolatopsis balhimycina DSM 5908 TaxID=1081091 RepID=A0A428W442_AMYBA|nr:C40 family peptidase [Amycolatopsis balhimycina]RSM37875.1 NlpC/P60 family protein [Amycolatopsis balhimycina DSM 5908]